MSLHDARARVTLAERAAQQARGALNQHLDDLGRHSRSALTPTRILLGGLATGALLGATKGEFHMLRAAASPRLLELASMAGSLFSAMRAHQAAKQTQAVAAAVPGTESGPDTGP